MNSRFYKTLLYRKKEITLFGDIPSSCWLSLTLYSSDVNLKESQRGVGVVYGHFPRREFCFSHVVAEDWRRIDRRLLVQRRFDDQR